MVVFLAVIPDELNVVEHLLDCSELAGLEFFLDFQQVHWVFDDERIVVQIKFFPFDGVEELGGLWVIDEIIKDEGELLILFLAEDGRAA